MPAFVFMGVMMERSGIANDLLYCVQVLLKRVPGALALIVQKAFSLEAGAGGLVGTLVQASLIALLLIWVIYSADGSGL